MRPPRLSVAFLAGFLSFAVLLYVLALVSMAGPPNELCPGRLVVLPRTVAFAPGVDPAPWRAAMAEWDALRPRTFVEVGVAPDVLIVDSRGRGTWVDWRCDDPVAVVHADAGDDLGHWAAHELAHALGWADHLSAREWPLRERWGNPGYCPGEYAGIMSYCTPRAEWWGADDIAALYALPHRDELPHRLTLPCMAINGGPLARAQPIWPVEGVP